MIPFAAYATSAPAILKQMTLIWFFPSSEGHKDHMIADIVR